MGRKALLLTILFLSILIIPITINEGNTDWPRIPATAYTQSYGNVIVHSDFRLIPQTNLIRWSLTRDIWINGLNWWTLDQSPVPVHIILISDQRKAELFKGLPQFAAPGVYFYDPNNNAFWFGEDISQSNLLIFLENGEFYINMDGSYFIFQLMLEKLFLWITGYNEAWNNRELGGHNPFLLNAAKYATSRVIARDGLPPQDFSYNRFYISWEEVKIVFQMAGWPKEHIDRVPSPVFSSLANDPNRYHFLLNMGVADQEIIAAQFTKILLFFAGSEPKAQKLRNTVIRNNLQTLEQICETRKDC